MIRYSTVALFLFLLLTLKGYAQCEQCPQIPGDISDFCYSSTDFPGKCGKFTQDSKEFFFQDQSLKKNPFIKLKLPDLSSTTIDQYLISLSTDKVNKFAVTDLLFLRQAILAWDAMEAVRTFDRKCIDEPFTLRPSGLAYRILVRGTGKLPEAGKQVNVHYTGRFADGKKFDCSWDRKQSYGFKLGAKEVIAGWDEGVALLPVGTRALLRIPPELGYGSRGYPGAIPPNATLYFEIQVMSAD